MHANFAAICDNMANEIVDAGIAEELVELENVDRFGNTKEKKDSLDIK